MLMLQNSNHLFFFNWKWLNFERIRVFGYNGYKLLWLLLLLLLNRTLGTEHKQKKHEKKTIKTQQEHNKNTHDNEEKMNKEYDWKTYQMLIRTQSVNN